MQSPGLVFVALAGCSYPAFSFTSDAQPDGAPDSAAIDTAVGDEPDTAVPDATLDTVALDGTLDVAEDAADAERDACACPPGQLCESGACRPLASCGAIKAAFPMLPSGAFTIDPDGSGPLTPFSVFCEMSADGGGWTLALKLDGNKTTFAYASPLWTNTALLNPSSTNNSSTEAKFRSYLEVPFTRVRVRMFDGTTPRYFPLDVASTSLRALFSGAAVGTTAGRARWLSLVADSVLQDHCNAEGVNREFLAGGSRIRMRMGIVGNNETHCDSPDSYLGFGVSIESSYCFGGTNPNIVVGNLAGVACDAAKDKAVATFGFLYVR